MTLASTATKRFRFFRRNYASKGSSIIFYLLLPRHATAVLPGQARPDQASLPSPSSFSIHFRARRRRFGMQCFMGKHLLSEELYSTEGGREGGRSRRRRRTRLLLLLLLLVVLYLDRTTFTIRFRFIGIMMMNEAMYIVECVGISL